MGDMALQSRRSFLEEAEAFLEKGDDLAALDLAGLRLERLPGDPDACIVICRVRIWQGRLDEAGEILRELEDLLVSFSRIYRELGDSFLEKGMPDSAKIYYRKFIALNPDTPAALEIAERLEGILDSHGADDGAGAEEETIRVPDDFQTVTLAELYIRQGHLQMAEKVLEAILRKEPQHEKAAVSLRELRERLGGEHSAANTKPTLVIAELTRWLDNIGRLRNHAA
jgi:tetratricopeptide (TPR) repeat protein